MPNSGCLSEPSDSVFQYLLQQPGAPASQWPGKPDWTTFSAVYLDSAWKSARQSGVLERMDVEDVRQFLAPRCTRLDNRTRPA